MNKEETISNLKAYLDGDMAIGNIIPLRSVLESAIKYLEPSLPSNLDEAAEEYAENILAGGEDMFDAIADGFKAGAEWMNKQMKMPNSTKLISEWHNVKTILEEKDFRGDEWRLAYNAFMFGFSRGINTQKTEK